MLSDRVWKNKVGAHHSVGSLRTLLRPLQRVFAGLVFNGYVMGIERCRVTSKEGVKEREVSFLPSCFIYEGCWCSHGSDSWMEGREERRAEKRSGARVYTASHYGNHFPAHRLHSTSLYYTWPLQGVRFRLPDDAVGLLVPSFFGWCESRFLN